MCCESRSMWRPTVLRHLILVLWPATVLSYTDDDRGTLVRRAKAATGMTATVDSVAMLQVALGPDRAHDSPSLLHDYVVPTKEVDCITRSVLQGLRRHSSARRVLLVAPKRTCDTCGAEAKPDSNKKYPEVLCVEEDQVVPGVSYASVKAWFDQKYGVNQSKQQFGFGGHDLAGWYLQQFVKMGIAEAAGRLNLTTNFVIWDSDMVLLRKFHPFNEQGQANLMESDAGRNECNENYQASFEKLTQLPYSYSSRGHRGFTTHHMVASTQHMMELLNRLGSSGQHWSQAILEASCPNLRVCSCGFSEYGAYASWMKHQHPDLVAEVPQQYKRLHRHGVCCPADSPSLLTDQDSSTVFIGFERTGCTKSPSNSHTKLHDEARLPR